jgi:hypothetical protein
MIHLPAGVVALPQWCRQRDVFTFNEGGKDDFNFVFDLDAFYDFCPRKSGWGPRLCVAGDCWRGRKPGQAFFGQVQLAGGKYGRGRRAEPAPQVVDRVAVNKHAAKLLSHPPAHLALAAGRDPHHHEADGARTIGRE